jgi:S-formylglutathione hydrolase FrmB
MLAMTLRVSAQFGPAGPQSKIETKTMHSRTLDADRDYNIFLPKSYETDTQKKYPVLYLLHWFVDCGDDDFLLDRNIEFTQAMRKAGIPCQFRVRDGGHTFEYWHSALYICLPFVSRNFGK